MSQSRSGGSRRPRAGTAGLLWFAIPLLLFAALWYGMTAVPKWELQSLDWRFQRRGPLAPSEEVVIVGIDQASSQVRELFDPKVIERNRGLSLMAVGWPWPREIYGILCDRLLQAGARVVALDLLFPNPSMHGPEDDAAFAAVLKRHAGRIVIGANMDNAVAQGEAGASTQIVYPIEQFGDEALVGLVNYFPDSDGVIRHARYEISPEESESMLVPEDQRTYVPAFPLQILRSAIGADRAATRCGGVELIPFLGPGLGPDGGQFAIQPFHSVIDDETWQANFRGGEAFRGKIVLVGPTAPQFQDKHFTPFGTMAGVEIHANVVAAKIRDLRLRELAPEAGWLPVLLLCSMVAYSVPRLPQNALLRLASLVAVMVAYSVLSQWLFQAHSVVVLLFAPLTSMALVGIGIQAQDFWVEQRERARLRRTLETHVSKNIADALLSDRDRFQSMLGGVRRPVTILFSDVRDFTSLSENARPEELVAQLNEYLSAMVDCILHENGTLHKFIGDAVMAVWGDTVSEGTPSDARRALRAGLRMFERLRDLNAAWTAQGRIPMRMGVGINHGEVVVGNIGSTRRMEFTVIGDPVNLASRLEGATKEFHVDTLIGEDVHPLVKDAFLVRSAGRIQVKGRAKPVQTFEVVAEAGDPQPRIPAALIQTFEAAMTAYYNRRFGGAVALFDAFLDGSPEDFLARSYLEESRRFLDSPPPETWDGTYVMRTK